MQANSWARLLSTRLQVAFVCFAVLETQAQWQNGFDRVISYSPLKNSSFASAPLGNGRSLVCYLTTCKVLSANGLLLDESAKMDFSIRDSSNVKLSLVPLDDDKAALCYRLGKPVVGPLRCAMLSLTGSTLKLGTPATMTRRATDYPVLGRLDTNKAVLCYRDNGEIGGLTTGAGGEDGFARCQVLLASGTNLSSGTTVDPNPTSSDHLRITQLTTDRAMLCYTSCPSEGCAQACNILAATGMTLHLGSSQSVTNGFPDEGGMDIARLDDRRALLCYRESSKEGKASCNILSSSGTSINVGASEQVEISSTYNIILGSLGHQRVLMCYNLDSAASQCKELAAPRNGDLSIAANVSSGPFYVHRALSPLSAGSVMSCFQDTQQNHNTKCRVVTSSYVPQPLPETERSSTTTTTLPDGVAPIVQCGVLISTSEEYVTDGCGNTKPGETCLVTCNYDGGWSGTAARFQCDSSNTDPHQPPKPLDAWPSCGFSRKEMLALYFGIGGSVLAVLSGVLAFLCPGGIRDCLRKGQEPQNDPGSSAGDLESNQKHSTPVSPQKE